jgi:hypothetical protein
VFSYGRAYRKTPASFSPDFSVDWRGGVLLLNAVFATIALLLLVLLDIAEAIDFFSVFFGRETFC